MTDADEMKRACADPGSSTPGLGPWRSADPPPDFVPFPDSAVDGSVGDRFADVALRFGFEVALRSPSGTWTYSELAEMVDRLAAGLVQRFGDATGVPIAVLADHDGPLVAAILGVIRAGHVVVVLDPVAPMEQSRYMLAEVGAAMVLHDVGHTEMASDIVAGSRGVGSSLIHEVRAPCRGLPSRAPDAPAMLAFTSGTSGRPKAAVITHGLLLNLVRGATNSLGIGPSDRMPMLFPVSMAVAAYPMLLPLLNGGALATLDIRAVGFEPFGRFLEEERITVAYLAPTVVRFLVEALDGRTFTDLRMVALGGEGIDADAVELTRRLFAPTHIGVGYGTTETGVISLGVLDGHSPSPPIVTCGYAVPGAELFVLDDAGNLLPQGAAGEVAVSSPHMFDGYLGHPDLDAVVLSEDPQNRSGWRMYRTGDHGRLDRDGALVVQGRLDTKVKIRGRFVVLGDVEAAVNDLDGVAAAAVAPSERDGVTELIAYVVPTGGGLDPVQLRARLLEVHESYRVPSRWVVVSELPRLPNGKIDRRALPAVDPDQDRDAAASVPGHSVGQPDVASAQVEHIRGVLLSIWGELLPVGEVGLDDDFMHLGGDSLLAAQMLVALEQRLGVTVPMGELIHARSVRALAEVVRRVSSTTQEPSVVSCVQIGDEPDRPRLWFVHDLQGSAYRVRHVADALGDDQPVWSFESPLLRGEPDPFGTLEAFAARYVADMRAAQPQGPYWLGGYSFGGICAYEMARQLVRDGQQVAFLAVVDVGPGYRGPGWHGRRSPFRPWFGVAKPPEPGVSIASQVRHYLEMARSGPGRLARHLMVRSGAARVIDPIRFRHDLRTHGRVRPAWRLWYAWEEHWRLAAQAWDRSRTYDDLVDLFWADETPSADATLGWGPLVRDVQIHRFAGDHMGILEDRGAPSLARALRAVVDDRIRSGGG